ncbi:hypothetical protein [Cupriavidus sp. TMH.W2]|uniref:hypothetical protein n=1 Tax=Cupriavidus sp. TMH.W2 TaxID=3434465 RepID=UPI003D771B63
MMNARDALGLQEDLAILNAGNAHRRAPDYPTPDESGNAVAAVALALKARNNDLAGLRKQLSDTSNSRHDQIAFAFAAKSVIDSLIQTLSEVTGQPAEDVQSTVYELLSRRYDAEVEGMIQRRSITRDVRQDPEVRKRRDWYIPAL